MQKLLHNYTHTHAADTAVITSPAQGDESGGSGSFGKGGDGEGDSGDAGGGKSRSPTESTTSHLEMGSGLGGERAAEGIVAGRVRRMVGPLAPVAESLARPPRKRKLDMDTQTELESRTRRRVHTVAHTAQHIYRHTDLLQSLQDTTSTNGQASLHGGRDGNYTE
jgi:hypothetical protein